MARQNVLMRRFCLRKEELQQVQQAVQILKKDNGSSDAAAEPRTVLMSHLGNGSGGSQPSTDQGSWPQVCSCCSISPCDEVCVWSCLALWRCERDRNGPVCCSASGPCRCIHSGKQKWVPEICMQSCRFSPTLGAMLACHLEDSPRSSSSSSRCRVCATRVARARHPGSQFTRRQAAPRH